MTCARLLISTLGLCAVLGCALGIVPPPEGFVPAPGSSRPAVDPQPLPPGSARFERFDVFIDSGAEPLAAYQVEVKASGASVGRVTIVGIEGGDTWGAGAAYNAAPFYDPLAMQGDTVIIGALAQGTPPTQRIRVASVHVMVAGHTPPTEMSVRLMTAGKPDGGKIDVNASVEKREVK